MVKMKSVVSSSTLGGNKPAEIEQRRLSKDASETIRISVHTRSSVSVRQFIMAQQGGACLYALVSANLQSPALEKQGPLMM